MASDALQSFLVIVAVLGAVLFVRFLTGTKARTGPASAAQPPRDLPAPGDAGLLPVPPPVRGVLDIPAAPIAQPSERRGRRLSLVEARNGIVLATILGACRAHRVEEPW
jgi:hypothetical protein